MDNLETYQAAAKLLNKYYSPWFHYCNNIFKEELAKATATEGTDKAAERATRRLLNNIIELYLPSELDQK